jgi:oligo-1,6-glucosidase/alpha-glucosidase
MNNSALPWWQQTVIYQIYPRSFQDSNGDGIGDIPGIISRLDYLKDLGVETIWCSPFFSSPQVDFGYDISNYRDIAPEYGTLQDAEQLISEVHQRGMKIIFDMVMNHTSDQHPWFLESKSSRYNPKSDWYIWKDGKGKNPPNNWKSIVWGKGWHYCAERNQWYFASFLPFQPDLNYRNPEVRREMFDTVRFWLDKGVDGFRLDIFNCIIKDADFRDNPFTINPFPSVDSPGGHFQVRKYTVNHPENFEFARDLKSVLDEYGPNQRFLLGEVFGRLPTVKQFLGNQDGLHLVFLFETLYFKFSAKWFKQIIKSFEQEFSYPFIPTWVLGNHDNYRYMRRIGNDLQKARLLVLLQLTLRAVPTLYYGEEVGLQNAEIPIQKAQDPLADVFRWIPAWFRNIMPVSINRDVCRTPMQWDQSLHAGFSESIPWLPVSGDAGIRNVAVMQNDKTSLWHWYRELLHLRKNTPALHAGSFRLLDAPDEDVLMFERCLGDEKILVAIHFGKKAVGIPVQLYQILASSSSEITHSDGRLYLKGLSGIVVKL